MNIKEKASLAWESAEHNYSHMNREMWSSLYPGWKNTVKAHFIMGWIAGFTVDVNLRNIILSSNAIGDQARMSTEPFMHGYGEGFLARLDCKEVLEDVIDISANTEQKQLPRH
jgi:hypothetical protein